MLTVLDYCVVQCGTNITRKHYELLFSSSLLNECCLLLFDFHMIRYTTGQPNPLLLKTRLRLVFGQYLLLTVLRIPLLIIN